MEAIGEGVDEGLQLVEALGMAPTCRNAVGAPADSAGLQDAEGRRRLAIE
jgi:hypothetical protein